MRVLVLGAYGFIGSDVARALRLVGHEVTGLGRSAALGRSLVPDIAWIGADIATLSRPEDWRPILSGVEAVVNASGALQDGARDNLQAVQSQAICALIEACSVGGISRYVQISAVGATPDADTAFMRTKAEADAALRASSLDWIILKPGLVIGANAYGGSALLRMLAAMPIVQPLVFGSSRVQTVALRDVSLAVLAALAGKVPVRRDYDLVADQTHTLREIVAKMRAWLGLRPARWPLELPPRVGLTVAKLADAAGWLGWRSPLRTTAMRVLAQGVHGNSAPWHSVTGAPLRSFDDTLAGLPSTAQERLFARAQLAFPVLLVCLAAFWLLSGAIALWQFREAVSVLDGSAAAPLAPFLVAGGSLVDLAIGAALCFRATARRAALAAIAVSLLYLVSGTLLTPSLWADPLGPLVKIIPSTALALAVAALLGDR